MTAVDVSWKRFVEMQSDHPEYGKTVRAVAKMGDPTTGKILNPEVIQDPDSPIRGAWNLAQYYFGAWQSEQLSRHEHRVMSQRAQQARQAEPSPEPIGDREALRALLLLFVRQEDLLEDACRYPGRIQGPGWEAARKRLAADVELLRRRLEAPAPELSKV